MTRWEALVRFDDEIREAAAKLIPFGSIWVDKLGEALVALNEDRKYLPNIVTRLTKQAEQAAVLYFFATFSKTAGGETTSEEALSVLADAQAAGYRLSKDEYDGVFLVIGNTGTSCLRSNADIVRFGEIEILRQRAEGGPPSPDPSLDASGS
jgi:hypothetical protein